MDDMSNTIERTINAVNGSVTERLDELETTLPPLPAKALAATRASARRFNHVAESAFCSGRIRADRVRSDVDTAASTSAGTDNVDGALDDAKLAADPDGLSTWTKAELYQRAQELDIEGRSSMNKAELVEAVQEP